MIEPEPPHTATSIDPADTKAGFFSGVHALDDYFARHAVPNDKSGVSRAYVLRRGAEDNAALPSFLGYYTLSMANAEPSLLAKVLGKKMPKFPLPVALIGRLAVDQRARGQRFGERLLIDALRRVVHVAAVVGCTGIVVDAKDAGAATFYGNYGFINVSIDPDRWPQRMFMPIEWARGFFEPEPI